MGDFVLPYAGCSTGHKLNGDGMGEVGIGGTLDCHRELRRGNGDHCRISCYQKRGCKSDSGHTVGGGGRMRSERKLGIVIVIVVSGGDNVGDKNRVNIRDPQGQ